MYPQPLHDQELMVTQLFTFFLLLPWLQIYHVWSFAVETRETLIKSHFWRELVVDQKELSNIVWIHEISQLLSGFSLLENNLQPGFAGLTCYTPFLLFWQVFELLCQILQTDSLSTVQQWLLLAGQRGKEIYFFCIWSSHLVPKLIHFKACNHIVHTMFIEDGKVLGTEISCHLRWRAL